MIGISLAFRVKYNDSIGQHKNALLFRIYTFPKVLLWKYKGNHHWQLCNVESFWHRRYCSAVAPVPWVKCTRRCIETRAHHRLSYSIKKGEMNFASFHNNSSIYQPLLVSFDSKFLNHYYFVSFVVSAGSRMKFTTFRPDTDTLRSPCDWLALSDSIPDLIRAPST